MADKKFIRIEPRRTIVVTPDKLVEKGSRLITVAPATTPPTPKTPAASANTPAAPAPAKSE